VIRVSDKKKAIKRNHFKKVGGLIICSMGTGMLLVILVPGWGFLLAAFLVTAGVWCIFS